MLCSLLFSALSSCLVPLALLLSSPLLTSLVLACPRSQPIEKAFRIHPLVISCRHPFHPLSATLYNSLLCTFGKAKHCSPP
ncbi:hypothetical protein LX32DRAFT_638170 [Colletotrichum zoysiae]|uniref:Secreted protein n=1 Tax=Colletotrichum zoysiae TaxID=1216348 RepID=A0AAD9M2E4_9PEZI|nr:hypothetical protein LX32DRAFT_638170 [Colletotrichum zoysiae]